MKRESVNFDTLILSKLEEMKICQAKFSYGGVSPIPTVPNKWEKSFENYAKCFKYLVQNGHEIEYDKIVQKIRDNYTNQLIAIGFQSSNWGLNNSWIEWDILKQLYFFLTDNQTVISSNYRIENPLLDGQLQTEIMYRHIGWEYWYLQQIGGVTKWNSNFKVQEILNNPKYKSSFDYTQISSWGLILLGNEICG